ncbi:MAG: 4Fe-4S cluster-binding domain-containing protein [Promethearchaeota archaeon]
MLICEIFRSIQGEVQGLGRFALFIRTFGCNLGKNCPLECDTRYSWDASINSKNITEYKMTIDELNKKIFDFNGNVIVITGGEPLLQQEEIKQLIISFSKKCLENNCINHDERIWFVETNGTIKPIPDLVKNNKVFFNVSPKSFDLKFDWFPLDRTIFKFVVNAFDNRQLHNATNFVSNLPTIIQEKVYFMPLSRDRETYISNAKVLADWCTEKGFNFAPRIHLVLWNGRRMK